MLFNRQGDAVTTNILYDNAGKPYTMVPRSCTRCGGAGGSDKWAHTGWTCFECGGCGKHRNGPRRAPLYTAEKIEKLNAGQAKRAAKRAAIAAAKAAAESAAADERRAGFYRVHGELLSRCETYIERSEFIRDVVRRAGERCELTEGQVSALGAAIARYEAEDARRAAAAFIGKVGERLRGLRVTCIYCHTIDYGGFSGWGRFLHITTLRTQEGNTIVVKSPSFWCEKGKELTISATVKGHDVYKGERQTVMQRVKVEC